jgi:hypothetical protein
MLTLAIMAIGFLISPSQHSLAQKVSFKQETTKQTLTNPKTVKQVFKDFCFIYYHDGNDKEEDQDTRVCQNQSSAFASLMRDESPKGSKQWGIQASLDDLAKQNLLTKNEAPIQNQQDFANSISNGDLKALVSGSGDDKKKIPQDKNFLPNLWEFKLMSASTPTPNPGATPSSMPNGNPGITSPNLTNINVSCRFTTTLMCTVTTTPS